MSSPHIQPDDLALYALEMLPAAEAAAIRAHLQQCGNCRQELAAVQGDLVLVALSTEMHAPAPASRDRLMQQVAREPRANGIANRLGTSAAVPAVPRRDSDNTAQGPRLLPADEPARSSLAVRALPWLGWAAAAALAVSVSQIARQRDLLRDDVSSVNHQIAMLTEQTSTARRLLETLNNPSAQRVTLTLSKQRPVPQGKATYDANRAALVFVANNLEPLEPQKTYELWIIPANGDAPVAAGIFHPDEHGNASVLLPKLPTGVAAKAFGVTIENEGGSPTPTMPIILAGAAG